MTGAFIFWQPWNRWSDAVGMLRLHVTVCDRIGVGAGGTRWVTTSHEYLRENLEREKQSNLPEFQGNGFVMLREFMQPVVNGKCGKCRGANHSARLYQKICKKPSTCLSF